jgi:D-alanine-D-alanine ligase
MSSVRHIAVLMGGASAERPVSLASGVQVLSSLDRSRFYLTALDAGRGALGADFMDAVSSVAPDIPVGRLEDLPALAPGDRPDVVVVVLHGPGGEDGTVQGFLSVLGIPFTGSGVLASALAMDKVRAKQMFTNANIPTPAGLVFEQVGMGSFWSVARKVATQLGYPVVVKPARQGSSFGTSVVGSEQELESALDSCFRYDDTALVEERIVGVEITVAVLGNHDLVALPAVEIVPKQSFFDFEAKYSTGEFGAEEICPARLDPSVGEEAAQLALECHRVLGCRGMSRTDMMVTEDGCVVLETNTVPGMTRTSLLPKAAAAAGIGFAELLTKLVSSAVDA